MKLYKLATIVLLFFGGNVLAYFGYVSVSLVTAIAPSFYLLLLLLVGNRFRPLDKYARKREEMVLFGICGIISFTELLQSEPFASGIINFFLLPIFFSYLYPESLDFFGKKIRRIIVLFYCVDSGISIIERVLVTNFFPFTGVHDADNMIYTLEGFRSTALQDHPLNNALCLSIIILFILTTSHYSIKNKMILFFIGYSAILCFNTRSSMILWAVMLLIYFINNLYSTNVSSKNKLRLLSLGVCIVSLILFLVIKYNLGDRLTSQELLDGSAMVRISSLAMFQELDIMSLLFGVTTEKVNAMMDVAGIQIIENFWVIFILKYGLLQFLLLLWGFYRLIRRIFRSYTIFQKGYCILFFLILASTNNSLAVYATPLCLLVLCGYSFRESCCIPDTVRKIR